jgi:N utilization substance protein B
MSESSSHRQKRGREGALLVLYGMDMTEQRPGEALPDARDLVCEVDEEIVDNWELVEWRAEGVYEMIDQVDERVQGVSPKWRVERMARVDRNILRIGCWELFESDILPVISIDACIELAKSYGEESTPGFVNGLLDQLCSDHGIEVA